MKAVSILSVAIMMSIGTYGQIVTSVSNGSATDPSTWDCTCIPNASNDVVVQHDVDLGVSAVYSSLTVKAGASFTHNGTGNSRILNDLTIEVGAIVTNNRRMDIYGNYAVNGEHAGSKNIRIRGTGNTITGVPNGYISNSARLVLMDGDKTIPNGNSITKNSGNVRIASGITVNNHGAFQGRQFQGSTGATWINHPGSWLAIRGSWATSLTLDAQANSNIVVYNRVGTGNQVLADPVGNTYHDLEILGNDLASRKRLRDDIIVEGDLTIGTSTLDARRSGLDYDIEIHGNWNNQSGNFARRTSTVTFTPYSPVQISNPTEELFYNLVISGSDTVTLKSPVDINNDLMINHVLDVDQAMSNSIRIGGDLTVSGSLITRFGVIEFDGSDPQFINGDVNFNSMTINSNGGVELQTGVHNMKGTLSLVNGNLETNGGLSLNSNEAGTARIGEVTGGTISGDVTVERYIDAGATNWRFLSSPVSGQTLADWDDDFVTSGFVGSDHPSFPFTSIYTYDEGQPGTDDDGFVPASADSDPINIGEGYWVWCGDSLGGTAPFTIDVKGPANYGPIDLNIDFTPISGLPNDGWCMVGNPYASTIDWNSIGWNKTNVDDAIYIWDPETQQFASYVNGVGTNGGSPYIASSQAFWVKANATAPVLQVEESAKTPIDAGFKSNSMIDGITLQISGNGFQDETVIRTHADASDLFDPTLDALKMFSSNPNVPSINTQILGPVDMAINSLPEVSNDISIPVRTLTGNTGTYVITAIDVEGAFNHSCIVLEDLYTGSMTPIQNGASYSFTLSDTTVQARFVLHVGAPVVNNAFDATCAGANDGSALVTGAGNGPWDYTWSDDQGNVIQTMTGMTSPGLISDLGVGAYTVEVTSLGSCPSVTVPFEINEPQVLSVAYAITNASCEGSFDGGIDLEVNGGTAPYVYNWNTGSQDQDIDQLTPGTYDVQIEDVNHCAQSLSFTVASAYDVTSSFTASSTEIYMSAGGEVECTNTSVDATEYRWNFGDGSPIQFGTNATHTYTTGGVYTTTLRAINMDCYDEFSMQFTVIDDVTSTNDLEGIDGIIVEQSQMGDFLVLSLAQPSDLTIQVFNSIGQEITEKRTGTFYNDRIELPKVSSGSVMIVSVLNEATGETFAKKVVR